MMHTHTHIHRTQTDTWAHIFSNAPEETACRVSERSTMTILGTLICEIVCPPAKQTYLSELRIFVLLLTTNGFRNILRINGQRRICDVSHWNTTLSSGYDTMWKCVRKKCIFCLINAYVHTRKLLLIASFTPLCLIYQLASLFKMLYTVTIA